MSQCFHEPISTETNDYDELPDTPVLDVSPASDSFEFPHLWGTLVCIDSQMEHTELLENEYTFGRDYHNVDFVLKHSSISNCNFSKKHFTIGFNGNTREAYIIDNSTNGTFVDSKKLSKNEKHNLLHLNRISAISDKNKVFIFLEETKYNDIRTLLMDSEILNKYFICDTLGKGCFGTVKLCVKKENKFLLAMKEVQNALDKENRKYFANEVDNLKSLSHPNIVTLYESVLWKDNIYMFLEYVQGGDLKSKIEACVKLSEETCKCIVYQIAMALQYLHSLNIVHRDLKPANILLKQARPQDPHTIVKVCDFGLSKNIDASSLKTKVGTPMFVAPEVLFGNRYDKKVDVWSLGVILYLCLSGKYPFPADKEFSALQFLEALKQGLNLNTHSWLHATNHVKNLLLRMIVFNPMKRCDVRDVLMHTWINKDQNMISSLNEILTWELSESDRSKHSFTAPTSPNGNQNSTTLLGDRYNLCGN